MKSGYRITWSRESSENLDQIITYLESYWTKKEIRIFFAKLDKTVLIISSYPELFPLTNKRKNIRKCVLSKQISLYYQIGKDDIFIVSLFDNRQSPNKLNI